MATLSSHSSRQVTYHFTLECGHIVVFVPEENHPIMFGEHLRCQRCDHWWGVIKVQQVKWERLPKWVEKFNGETL